MASKEASEIDTVEQLYHTAQHYIGQVSALYELQAPFAADR